MNLTMRNDQNAYIYFRSKVLSLNLTFNSILSLITLMARQIATTIIFWSMFALGIKSSVSKNESNPKVYQDANLLTPSPNIPFA